MKKSTVYILLFLIIALGIFLRVYNIDTAPPGIYPDEAVNGLDAREAAATGDYKLFYESNNGREGLYINSIAVFFKFFGFSMLTFKLTSILFGILAVWGVYLLVAELFRSRRLGLIAAFLISASFWAINFSRIGFRAIMVPAILAFSFYFLFRGVRTRGWHNFAIGGLIFGLGLHTYISFRIAPAILIFMLIPLWLTREKFLKKYIWSIIIFVIFAGISAGPMLYDFFVAHPEHWASRTTDISILNPVANEGHPFKTFGKTLGLALAKYTFWGDQNWRQNYPPYAILDPLTGLAFLFGFIYSVFKLFHLFYLRLVRKIHDEKLEVYSFLLIWFFIMLVPEVMGAEGNPHALRSIGTLPVVFIFAALTFNYFLGKEKESDDTRVHKKIIIGILWIMLALVGIWNGVRYFHFWAKNPESAKAFEKNITSAAQYTAGLASYKEIYFVADNMQRVPPRFLNFGRSNFHDLYPTEIGTISPRNSRNLMIVFTDFQKEEIIKNLSFPRRACRQAGKRESSLKT